MLPADWGGWRERGEGESNLVQPNNGLAD
jgi:hypothetical protein